MSGLDLMVTPGEAEPNAMPIAGVALSLPKWARSSAVAAKAGDALGPIWALVCEFPAVPWAIVDRPPSDALVIEEHAWRAPSADLYVWDRAFGAAVAAPRWLVVQGAGDGRTIGDTAYEILSRYQRFVPRTNASSATPLFRKVLEAHQAIHDLSLPLVRADYDHALDVWQWALRLLPGAGLELQLAALFHDIERLMSEPEQRIEHIAPDYQAFKNAHAEVGARMTARVLGACGVGGSTVGDVVRLITEHEFPHDSARGGPAEVLADADALSFFSLNSPGFADYYGPEHTRRKVSYTLGRMSAAGVRRLTGIRLRSDVAHLLAEVARTEAYASSLRVCA
jgi:hypothetical protein